MLHFDKFTGRNESLTRDASRMLVKGFLDKKLNVIIDDTNLNPSTFQSWKDLAKEMGCKIQIETLDTPWEECVQRDNARAMKGERSVGPDVIFDMALSSGLFKLNEGEKGFVICDIDGTLADIDHRRHHVQGEKKDWKGFFSELQNDTLRLPVKEMVDEFIKEGYIPVLVSGRPELYRDQTRFWLSKHEIYAPLVMRKANDARDDVQVKQEIYDRLFKGKYPVYKVIDDRPSVIRMWRSNGLDVIDVGNGVEF